MTILPTRVIKDLVENREQDVDDKITIEERAIQLTGALNEVVGDNITEANEITTETNETTIRPIGAVNELVS